MEIAVSVLIAVSLVTMVLETIVKPDSAAFPWLTAAERVIWLLFCAEYVCRVAGAPVKRQYVLSFYGVIDLLAVLSGLTSVGALEGLKALRVLRALRVLKLVRYSNAIDRFSNAYHDIKDELALYLAASGILTFIAAYGIWEFEHDNNENYGNIFDCVYWAVASLTAGAENMAPVTVPGKILTMLLLLLGLGIVAVPPGLLASALSKQDLQSGEYQAPGRTTPE